MNRNAEARFCPRGDGVGLDDQGAREWVGQAPGELMGAAKPGPVRLVALGDDDGHAEPPARPERDDIGFRHEGDDAHRGEARATPI